MATRRKATTQVSRLAHRAGGTAAANRMTGSIGAREATVESHHQVESLAQLEAFFAKIGKIDAHAKWGKEMEPYVVSGTSLWNIYRIVE